MKDLSELVEYACELFAPEDEELQALLEGAREAGLPVDWGVAPDVGRLLQVFCRMVGARKVIEFGTLAGYSALWIARALPPDGRVISLESNSEYAAVARDLLAKTEAGPKVEVREGVALDMLSALEAEAPFDIVFLDADKEHYPEYLDWAARVLRPGGLLLADNVLHSSSWNGQSPHDPTATDPRVVGVRTFNQRLSADSRFTAVILPMRDGIAAAVFHP
jgi:caffeoyl-CoA O-methyltransferase